MAPAYVQSRKTYAVSNNIDLAFSSNIGADSLILVVLIGYGTPGNITIGDSQSNIYNRVNARSEFTSDSLMWLDFWYTYNAVGGACTVNYDSVSSSGVDVIILEYSGVEPGADPLDQQRSAESTGTTITSGNMTETTNAEDLIVSCCALYTASAVTITEGANFNAIREEYENGATESPGAVEDRVVSSTGTYAGTFGLDPSLPSIVKVAAFKSAVTQAIEGTVVWGHVTGVTETNVRTFASNWTGTGAIGNSGDTERLELNATEYMISEVVNTGSHTIILLQNNYSSGDTVTLQYRHGATQGACEAASWNNYTAPFDSLGYVQVRVESTL